MTDTFASLFSGGGLADIGAKQAGYAPLWGVEHDAKIANYYWRNVGKHILINKAQDVDYGMLEIPYWLHMSPPCINASQAKVVKDGVRETELDVEMARACCKAIVTLRPPMVSLENVAGYRSFKSFLLILRALHDHGYNYDFWILNSASYGVAQTRKRLILVASRVQRVHKPSATHRKAQVETGQLSLIPPLPVWNGWYSAIEDILGTLPDDEFSPWQIPLLPPELQAMLISSANSSNGLGERLSNLPAMVVTANMGEKGTAPRALLLANGQYNGKLVTAQGEQPSMAITANNNQGSLKAVLLRGDNQGQEWGRGYRDDKEPAVTVTSAKGQKAFIVDGQANDNGTSITVRRDEEPFFVASASQGKRPARAYTSGRVVRMTPRALARFQSIPDSYVLPDATGLACTIIGNGVPSLLMQRVIEANR